MKKIIVVGGGFAGLNFIEHMRRQKDVFITLVDTNNYYFFPPLIYQVATGFMEPSAISYPYRKILRRYKNVHFRMGILEKINTQDKTITLNNGSLPYDYLILATGTESNFFGMENVQRHAIPMKTISDAISMRNRILETMELASRVQDHAARRKLLNIVIAGAGPTGVEVSGMMAEMSKTILLKDYPEFKPEDWGKIYLIDGAPTVLAPMSTASQQYTQKKLKEMGVQLLMNVTVKDYKDQVVYLSDEQEIETPTLIWSAGVTSKVFEGLPEEVFGRGRRLIVDAYNRVENCTDVFALGDTCIMTADQNFPQGHPQLAQVAIQQGKNLAQNLSRAAQEWKVFTYTDKGSMAIIGSNKAVTDIPKPKMHLKGFPAWFVWVFIHIMSLVNYRNKMRALYNWVGAYFSKDQSFRMIIRGRDSK